MKQKYISPVAEYSVIGMSDILTESLNNLGAVIGECGGASWNDL